MHNINHEDPFEFDLWCLFGERIAKEPEFCRLFWWCLAGELWYKGDGVIGSLNDRQVCEMIERFGGKTDLTQWLIDEDCYRMDGADDFERTMNGAGWIWGD